MPHPLEFPRVLGAVIPLMRGEGFAGFWRAVIDELIARALHGLGPRLYVASGRLPRLAAVVGALDDLPEPAAALRCINTIGISRRTLEMVEFPPREMRTAACVDRPERTA